MTALQSKDKERHNVALDETKKDIYSDRDMYKFCENNREEYLIFRNFIQSPDCALTTDWPAHLQGSDNAFCYLHCRPRQDKKGSSGK